MFQPKYSLTNQLLSRLTQVERLYGQVEALKIPQKLELNLKRDNLIQSAYASNRIEGNPLTLPEVTNLLLDDRVPANRDEKEVTNYFSILSDLSSYLDRPFDVKLAVKFHSLLLQGVPHHTRSQIKAAVGDLMTWANHQTNLPVVISAGVFHHHFVFIHPFEDGNGRVCRLLTALIFLKRGYHINKYFILDDYYDIDRIQYSDKLHSADSGDKTQWLEYFAEGVEHSLRSAYAKFKTSVNILPVKNRPTKKEQSVLELMQQQPEITSTDLAKHLKVSRQQAHNLLKSLVEKGFIDQKGSTKSSYYVLK
jgi:Fic family protein